MDNPTITRPSPSSSVGDYLKAIWQLAETGTVSTKEVADRLSVARASVTNMLGHLREKGLVEYERYRGASLTEAGRIEALRLLRRHRLIETFLVEHLGYSWQEVHEEAERLEHAVSDTFTERLAELLGHPNYDPHGDPIPAADGTLGPDDSFPLAEAATGQRIRVFRVGPEDAPTLTFLEESGLVPGRVLQVKEVRALDGVVTVEDEDGKAHVLWGVAGAFDLRPGCLRGRLGARLDARAAPRGLDTSTRRGRQGHLEAAVGGRRSDNLHRDHVLGRSVLQRIYLARNLPA